MTKPTPTERNARARATATPGTHYRTSSALQRAALSPSHFAALSDSPVSDHVAEHARLVTTYRDAVAALRDHESADRAARAADDALMAEAVRADTEDPGTPHLDAWREELVRRERHVVGARGALSAAFSDLIDAVADNADDLVAANDAETDKHRARLRKALATAAEAVTALDVLTATTRLVEDIAENGEAVKARPLARVPRVNGDQTAADVLAAVADTYGA